MDMDDLMTDALDSMQDLAEAVRGSNIFEVHKSIRRWVFDQPEHAVIMLLSAACLVDPDEPLSARRHRLEQVMAERELAGA